MENQKSSRSVTLWQKLSVPLLTLGVALLVLFFKWLFGMMYPQDSYRVYTNWEITELTAENLLTEKRLDGLRQTIDRKDVKDIYLDSVDSVSFDSAGNLLSAELTFLAVEKGQGQIFHLSLFPKDESREYPVRLERQQGYVTEGLDDLSGRVPFEALYTLSHHPMGELANECPIANESRFQLTNAGGGITVQTDRENEALRAAIEEENVWFVRRSGGWFRATDPEQISPRFFPLMILEEKKTGDSAAYGWLMLEIPQ